MSGAAALSAVWTALLAALCGGWMALAQPRLAVVAYVERAHNAAALGAREDADALAAALARSGFQVARLDNPDKPALLGGLAQLAVKLQEAGPGAAGLVYFAGPAGQAGGRNHLVPARAMVAAPAELDGAGLRADDIVALLAAAGAGLNVLIIDASRATGPVALEAEPGLAAMEPAPSFIIGFGLAPGVAASPETRREGAFAAALVEALSAPGVEAGFALSRASDAVAAKTKGFQVPYVAAGVVRRGFSFARPGPALAGRSAGPGSARGLDVGGDLVEFALWQAARASGAPEDMRAYVRRHPGGAFAPAARAALAGPLEADRAARQLAGPGPANAAERPPDLVVDPEGGGDARAIQEAVDAAPEGALIHVRPGTYVEDLAFRQDRRVRLVGLGEGEARPRLRAARGRALFVETGQPRIENFIIETDKAEAAIWMPGGRPQLVGNAIRAPIADCARIDHDARPTLLANAIGPCGGRGLVVSERGGGLIVENRFAATGAAAVALDAMATPILIGNVFTDIGAEAVRAMGAARPIVRDSRIEGGLRGLFIGEQAGGLYVGNVVAGTREQAIAAFDRAEPEILANTLSGGAGHCLHVRDQAKGRWERNSVTDCGSAEFPGVYIDKAASPRMDANVFAPGVEIFNANPRVDLGASPPPR